jgi:hypothetical protein
MAELWPLTRHTHDERFMEGTPPPKTPKRGGDHQRRRKIYILFLWDYIMWIKVMNHPFGNDLYHLFMVMWGMVY